MTAEAKHILGEAVQRQKPLRVRGGSNAAQMICWLPSRLVRDCGAVMRAERIEVFDSGHDCAMSRLIAFECIGHHPARRTAVAFE